MVYPADIDPAELEFNISSLNQPVSNIRELDRTYRFHGPKSEVIINKKLFDKLKDIIDSDINYFVHPEYDGSCLRLELSDSDYGIIIAPMIH